LQGSGLRSNEHTAHSSKKGEGIRGASDFRREKDPGSAIYNPRSTKRQIRVHKVHKDIEYQGTGEIYA
jgi:hypothetical protein